MDQTDPPSSLSISQTPLGTTHRKFFFDSGSAVSLEDAEEENKKVRLEVKLTSDQLKEIMKCKPSNEWVSKAGVSLKHRFPELAKAHEVEARLKRTAERRAARPPIQPIPFEVKNHSVCSWKGLNSSSSVQSEYMVLIKHILLRESSLRRLAATVQCLDSLYWKYASVIINRLQFDRSILTDDVQVMLMRIAMQQEELAVAIAHHRSLSVDVVESVQRWRRACQKNVAVRSIPSVFYENQNYLLKMTSDTQAIFTTQTMWMWLGFEPNMYMIPPNGHDPHALRLEREEKRREWIRRRQAWIQAQLENLRSLTANNITTRRISTAIVTNPDAESVSNPHLAVSQSLPLITRSRGSLMRVQLSNNKSADVLTTVSGDDAPSSSNSASSGEVVSDDCEGMRAPRNKIQEEPQDEDEGSRSVTESSIGGGEASIEESLAASSSTYSEVDEEWQELRNNCLPSWGTDEDPDGRSFWDNFDLNPLTVEAAVGFVDAFPSIYLVPPVAPGLATRCHKCELLIRDEEHLTQKTEQMRAECRQLRDEILSDTQLKKTLDDFDSEDKQAELMCEQYMLKARQERNKMRDNLHFQEISLKRRASSANSTRPTRAPHSADCFSVFLTSTADISPGEDSQYRINTCELRYQIEDKVDKDRSRMRRIGNALVVVRDQTLRQGKLNSTRPKRMNALDAVVRLQALIRGAITRSRVKRQKRAMKKMTSVLMLQRVGRRFLAKLRAKVAKRNYRRQMLILRKSINRRNKACNIIIYFMRYVVFLAKRSRYLRKYDMEMLATREPQRHQKILQAIVLLQKVYRGHRQRVQISRWTQQMRSRRFSARQSFKFIDHTQRTHHFTIAGSGGFKFRRKDRSVFPKLDPQMVKLIQQKGDYFQVLLTTDIKKQEEDTSVDVSSLEVENIPDMRVEKLGARRRLINSLPSERSTIAPPKKPIIGPNTFGSSVVSTKCILRAARSRERAFITDKYAHSSDPRSTNDAYVNPNVHAQSYVKPVSFASSSTASSNDRELTTLLQSIYGK